VTLEEAYQATMVSSFDKIPTEPIKLENVSINMIDNMFIVSPPEEIQERQSEESGGNDNNDNNILDFTDLDINYLEEDWDDEDLEFTELDMDLLDVDFLQDILVRLEEVNILRQKQTEQMDSTTNIVGTAVGFDKTTQYNTIVDESAGQIWFYREVNGIISIKIPIDTNATIESNNEDVENLITVGDGQSVIIIIRQGG